MTNLIQKAQNYKHKPYSHRTDYRKEEMELAVAYLNRKVTLSQFAHAMNINTSGSALYQKVMAIIQYGIDKGEITII
jgi:hypothetical protein